MGNRLHDAEARDQMQRLLARSWPVGVPLMFCAPRQALTERKEVWPVMKNALGNFHRITSVKALKDHLKPVIIPEMPNEKTMCQAAHDLIWDCDGITSLAKYASRAEKRQYVLVLLEEWRITALRNRWFCVRFLRTSPSIGEELVAVLNCLSREHKELKEATGAVCWYLDRNNVDDLLAAM